MFSDTFTETPVEELTPLDIEAQVEDISAAVQLLRQVEDASITDNTLPRHDPLGPIPLPNDNVSVPNYGKSYFGALFRTYGYLLALHYRIQREPDINLDTLRAEIDAHRAALTDENARFEEAAAVLGNDLDFTILNWWNKSWQLSQPSYFPNRELLLTGIRATIDDLWPLMPKLDEALLGITGSDGGTTP